HREAKKHADDQTGAYPGSRWNRLRWFVLGLITHGAIEPRMPQFPRHTRIESLAVSHGEPVRPETLPALRVGARDRPSAGGGRVSPDGSGGGEALLSSCSAGRTSADRVSPTASVVPARPMRPVDIA